MAKRKLTAFKGVLNGTRIFLSGPIDRVKDDGVIWRREFIELCNQNIVGLHFFDPTNKPKGLGSETGVEKTQMLKYLKGGKWAQAKKYSKQFRRYDLRGVDWADIVVAFIDINSHLCGTYDEVFTAYRESKPVFIILPDGCEKWQIPSWLVTYIEGPDDIFLSPEDVVEHLKRLNRGEYTLDSRFVRINA